MKKNFPLHLAILILLLSCKDSEMKSDTKTETGIEIYLPKNRINTSAGIEIPKDFNNGNSSFSPMDSVEKNHIRIDTLNQKVIYAGPFDSDESDLPNEPFITEEEIIGFNFTTNTLKLTQEGADKLSKLNPNFLLSNQFIITSNRKPILNGYFFNSFSSSYVDTYQMEYTHNVDGLGNSNTELTIRQNPITNQEEYNKLPDMTKNTRFYNAFKTYK